ncbi:MAG: RagB/SusD family nutrient uptake outer membrane protein [Cytophagales bacterium]|nr:RagB/SusD family nutrient uptake outer membrane protein [Cytophagales bacterium]
MMKKYILLLTFTWFFSCNDFLDVKPTGTVIPKTVEDFDKLLNNKLITHDNVQNVLFMDPDWWLPGFHYSGIWQPVYRKQYNWDPNPYEVVQQDTDWNGRYQQIAVYNEILGKVDDAELGKIPESSRNLVKGEALAQRAMDLFLLVNEYAVHFSASTSNEQGVPMPLEFDLLTSVPMSTVGEVYDQIVADLLTAEELLADVSPINKNANFRPGIASIKALLAEVYLYMGDFVNAEGSSEESLALFGHENVYDYALIDHNTPGSPWSAFNNDREWLYITDHKDVTWGRRHFQWFYDPAGLYHPDLAALFDKTIVGDRYNDHRFYLNSGDNTYYDNDVSVGPDYVYVRDYAATNAGLGVPRTMLTNAEAKARNSDGSGAIAVLNQLALYRYGTLGSTFSYTTDAAALQEAKDERRRELCFSGNNWFDLQRYHAYGETIPTYTRDIPGTGTITLVPGDDKYIVPIPRVVSNANDNF